MIKVTTTVIVMALAAILPRYGVTIGNETLTTAIQTLVEIVAALYIYFTHGTVVRAARAAGVKGV